jgi:hypothetical protein
VAFVVRQETTAPTEVRSPVEVAECIDAAEPH